MPSAGKGSKLDLMTSPPLLASPARVKRNGAARLRPAAAPPAPRPHTPNGAKAILPRLAVGDFLDIADLRREDFFRLLDLATTLKAGRARYRRLLEGRGLAMIFEKPSLRTRVTFDVAMQELGGYAVFLDFTDSPLGEREDIVDVARNLELWLHGIVARTFEHASIQLLADSAHIPVINGLSDLSHPCQALADFLTLRETFGDFRAGRRALKLAYVGDGNNTLHSLMQAAALAGIEMSVATPAGYEPQPAIVQACQEVGRTTGARLELHNKVAPAVRRAAAIYTDTWASMGQEAEATQRARDFADFQVNEAVMAKAAAGARFMHCLPAHRGQEVTSGVIDSPQSLVYRQAENRLHAQKAILAALLGAGA